MASTVRLRLAWVRQRLSWSNRRQAWGERAAAVLLLAAVTALYWQGTGLSSIQQFLLGGSPGSSRICFGADFFLDGNRLPAYKRPTPFCRLTT